MKTTLRKTTTGCLFAAALLSLSVGAVAQPADEGTGTTENATYSDQVDISEYSAQPFRSAPENVSAPLMVTLAYGITWLLTGGFLFMLWRRNRRVADEVSDAQIRLAQLDRQLAELKARSAGDAE